MDLSKIHSVYFIGIGGIGMSALARWFKHQGKIVAGYDRVQSAITSALEIEGIPVHYVDDVELIPPEIISGSNETLVVYTPAIPEYQSELNYVQGLNVPVLKRSEVVGLISLNMYTVAIAGTHGKTTTSSILAHILKHANRSVLALLGGLSSNYNSNYINSGPEQEGKIFVIEADEYDRSFHRLHPDYAVITSMDADHLDIYGDMGSMRESFRTFLQKVSPKGSILINEHISNHFEERAQTITYGIDGEECRAFNIRISEGAFHFDFAFGETVIDDIKLLQPGFHNVENATAAIKVCLDLGVSGEVIKEAIGTYAGVKRRFEYIINTNSLIYVDDYAHHPVEIDAFIGSLKALYPEKYLTAIFQPHLYSRTRDFAEEFAGSLSLADEVLLMDIYPAREEPIAGVTSEVIFEKIKNAKKSLVSKNNVVQALDEENLELLATIGAGDIDQLVELIKQKLSHDA